MSEERIKTIKNQLLSAIESQMMDLKSANSRELGEAVDMLKDLSEYCYYSKVVEAMDNNSDEKNQEYIDEYLPETQKYYTRPRIVYYTRPTVRYPNDGYNSNDGMDYARSRMYYSSLDNNGSNVNNRDPREGRAGMTRKTYMDIKDSADKTAKMQELEHYMHDLSDDITEMIVGMDANEKANVKQKITQLASKIA